MSAGLYDKARESFLGGDLDWNGGTAFKLMLYDAADYTPNFSTHDFLDDVVPGSGVTIPTAQASAPAIANRTITAGVADGDDVTITAATGDVSEGIIIFLATGTNSTSNLVMATDVGTGLPVTPNGGDIIVQFDSGSNKIFKL